MLPSKARKGEGNGRHMKTEQAGRLKLVEIVLLLFLAAFLATGAMALQTGQELSDKVVRLHVLANSDSEEDQALKLKVRDRILAYAEPLLAGAADRREAEALLRGQVLELERVAAEEIQAGDQVEVDFASGIITDVTTGKTYKAAPFPEFIDGIIQSGGLLNSLKERGLGR